MKAVAGVIMCAFVAWFAWKVVTWWWLARETRTYRQLVARVRETLARESAPDSFNSPDAKTLARTVIDQIDKEEP